MINAVWPVYHVKLVLYLLTASVDCFFNYEVVITVTNNLISNKRTAHVMSTLIKGQEIVRVYLVDSNFFLNHETA